MQSTEPNILAEWMCGWDGLLMKISGLEYGYTVKCIAFRNVSAVEPLRKNIPEGVQFAKKQKTKKKHV